MTDQLAINETGQIVAQPMTWDGEPLYSPSTIREGLFAVEAFEQMPGQTAMSTEDWSVEDGTEPPTQVLASVFGLGTRYFS